VVQFAPVTAVELQSQLAALSLSPDDTRSDCHESQLLRKVSEIAHRVHRLWDRLKRPACGLMGNLRAPVVHAGHGDLHEVLVLMMAFSISSKRRMVATIATLCSLPLTIRCS
jgi:hypothetical protein